MTDPKSRLPSVEDCLCPVVEARLAKIVEMIRNTGTGAWRRLQAIDENSLGEFDQLVIASFRNHLLGNAEFLLGLKQLLLHSQQLRLMREQRILGLEDLVVELRNRTGHSVEVSNGNAGPAYFSGNSESRGSCRNE